MVCNRAEGNESPRPPGQGQPQLVMRAPLTNLPECKVPASYSIRHFQPGDEAGWDEIIRDSFKDPGNSFDKTMKSDKAYEPERVLFVCYNGKPVATAAAWHRPEWGENTGYLHMVGTHSSYAGRGLGLQASLAALHRMAAEGRTEAVLQTDDFRIPAIKIYLKLGFSPVIVHESQPARWKAVFNAIGRPDLIDKCRSTLDGPISRIGRRDG
jgi:mycothiol synthase